MSLTALLRQQHRDLIELMVAFTRDLERPDLAERAGIVRAQLTRIASKLRIHLSMEDGSMYPTLLSGPETETKKMVRDSLSEVGDLALEFRKYLARWPSARSISTATSEFCRESEEIFGAMAYRMIRENDQLFSLLDLPAPVERRPDL